MQNTSQSVVASSIEITLKISIYVYYIYFEQLQCRQATQIQCYNNYVIYMLLIFMMLKKTMHHKYIYIENEDK